MTLLLRDGVLVIPNWLIVGAVNFTISAIVGGITGGGTLAFVVLLELDLKLWCGQQIQVQNLLNYLIQEIVTHIMILGIFDNN